MNSISAIYRITCFPTQKVYIGSTSDLKKRWNAHTSQLNNGNHKNRHLQRAWEKYGKGAFVFEILEICSVEQLAIREQFYLDAIKPFGDKGFNLAIFAYKSAKGIQFTPEHRMKIGNANRGKPKPSGRKKTTAEIMALVLVHRGRKRSAETCAKIGESKEKRYLVISPIGEKMEIKGLRKFCRDHGLSQSAMWQVSNGNQKTHKGWRCSEL